MSGAMKEQLSSVGIGLLQILSADAFNNFYPSGNNSYLLSSTRYSICKNAIFLKFFFSAKMAF